MRAGRIGWVLSALASYLFDWLLVYHVHEANMRLEGRDSTNLGILFNYGLTWLIGCLRFLNLM